MYHVVLAVDDDRTQARKLTDTIERLAKEADLKVTLVHVFRDLDVPPKVSIHQLSADFDEQMEESRDVPLSVYETADRLRELGCELQLEVRSGDASDEILKLTEELDVDAIHIGGRKTSPVGKVLFGSVAQDVIFHTDIPVTISGSPDE